MSINMDHVCDMHSEGVVKSDQIWDLALVSGGSGERYTPVDLFMSCLCWISYSKLHRYIVPNLL